MYRLGTSDSEYSPRFIIGIEPSRNSFPEMLKNRRFRKERIEAGIFPVKRLSARDRFSKLGKYFKKLKSPENLLEARSRTRRRISEDNSDGISPENLLFWRLRISSFRQSTIWDGTWSTSWFSDKESSLSSESRPIDGDRNPASCWDLKTSLVTLSS